MKIDFFGKVIEFNVKNKDNYESVKNKKNNLFMNNANFRIVVFIFIVSIFFLISLRVNNKTIYSIGEKVENDIIAYKDVTYTKNILDDELKNKIKKNTLPEYDRIDDIDKVQIDKLDQFFNNINQLDISDDTAIKEFINLHKLNLTISDVKKIGINKSVKYYLYLSNILSDIYEKGIAKISDFNKILADKEIVLTEEEKKLLLNFLEPNLELNEVKTLNKIEKNMELLKNSVVSIKKGDIILREGGVITQNIYDDLNELGYIKQSDRITKMLGEILIYIVASFLFYNISFRFLKKEFESKAYYPLMILVSFINLSYIYFFVKYDLKYLAPLLLIAIIGTTLSKNYLFTIMILSFNYIFVINDLKWSIIVILLSLLSIYINTKVTTRNELIKNSIYLGLIQAIFTFAFGLNSNFSMITIIPNIFLSLLSGLVTGILTIGILPYFENTFKILTDIKLLELSNFSNDLLRNLLLVAPGTFHHSIMVGALSEAGAEAIGANPILCRVASYYHDIGKMKRPHYFVENQLGIENPHNNLKASLSSIIITSHTKDGYLLGKQYNLPVEILDIILQHHGTTLVQYFYYKALDNNEVVVEDDFRYSGPKPISKEAGIIMLADTIEAAVRASSDKGNETIEKLVRYLIKSKIDDSQFSNCDLTLDEIEKVTKAFLTMIHGIYHERIKYLKGK